MRPLSWPRHVQLGTELWACDVFSNSGLNTHPIWWIKPIVFLLNIHCLKPDQDPWGWSDHYAGSQEASWRPNRTAAGWVPAYLFIERFCMTGGSSPIGYLKAWQTNLYLSADAEKVREALSEGIAAATMFMSDKMTTVSESQLRVAFDGDAVLFSDESERIFKAHGLDKFFEHERENEDILLDHGPFKGFLEALAKLQKKFYAKGQRLNCPIRTYLVTARSAASSGIRALKTLRAWGLEVDEALFLAGAPKGPMLEKIRPHIFFDDQMFHVEGAAEMGTVAAHVPYGVAQLHSKKK
uniref:5'-nucleotidase, cytosolic IAa n=1 Tax=Oryzias sinensis TaxID=183150 RepID=A0A8C7XU60_9TELE